jgi:hypothetical protein
MVSVKLGPLHIGTEAKCQTQEIQDLEQSTYILAKRSRLVNSAGSRKLYGLIAAVFTLLIAHFVPGLRQ